MKLGWDGPFSPTCPDFKGETRKPGNNISIDTPGFTGALREKGKLWMIEISPGLPQDQGQTKVIAVGGFSGWVKIKLICSSSLICIDLFFLSTNSY